MLRKLLVPILAILAISAGVMTWLVVRNRPAESVAGLSSDPPTRSASRPLRVLFIGNSFVFVNDLPSMLKGLAAADGVTIETKQHTPGGAQLVQQASSPEVRQLLSEHWDFVVLQEQSQLPSLEDLRRGTTEPALRQLMRLAAGGGSPPVLFETWGYRMGDVDNVKGDDYAAMQARLDDGFAALVAATGIAPVPVNKAWRAAHASHPEIELWSADGRHPAPAGTYLAACVFYNTLVRRAPAGVHYTASLPPAVATTMQDIASTISN